MRELALNEGRGGAVRRRKTAENTGTGTGTGDGRQLNVNCGNVIHGDASDGASSPSSLSDGGKAAAAAGDLLQASLQPSPCFPFCASGRRLWALLC